MTTMTTATITDTIHLARVWIDPERGSGAWLLANGAALHRAVMALFPADLPGDSPRAAGRILYRVEWPESDAPQPVAVLVQSAIPADLAAWRGEREGAAGAPVLSRADLALRAGDAVAFRLVAAPTVAVPREGRESSRRAITDPARRAEWFGRRLAEAGLGEVEAEEPTALPRVSLGRWWLNPWRVEGLATAGDVDALWAAMTGGVGHGRSYGCGLLTVARLSET